MIKRLEQQNNDLGPEVDRLESDLRYVTSRYEEQQQELSKKDKEIYKLQLDLA